MADKESKKDKQDEAEKKSAQKSSSDKPAKAEEREEKPSKEEVEDDEDEREREEDERDEKSSADDEDEDEEAKPAKKPASKPASKEPEKKSEKSKDPPKTSGSGGGGGGGKKPPPAEGPRGDNIRFDDLAPSVMKIMGGVGAVALVASIGLGMGDNLKRFMHSYLVAFMFTLSIALGALWWVTLQHLVNARWSVVVRRVGELLAAGMPIVAILSLPLVVPVLMGKDLLYPWANHELMEHNHALQHKAPYFSIGFYLVRVAVYFGFWSLLSHFFLKRSVAQDAAARGDILPKVRSISAPSMIAVALTLTFAAVDFMMSLDPMWFSTIFGVYYFAGCVIAVHATMALVLMWLQSKGRMQKSVTKEHFHDLGKMLFAFTVFWAYIGFSQFMLIWYANVPEETVFYKERFAGDWVTVSWALVFCHFAIPFFGLLSRHVKRHRTGLAIWAVWQLVMHYVDIYWLVMPNISHEHVSFNVLDVTCLVALVCLFLAGVAYRAGKVNLIAIKDPRLAKSLAFEQF